MTGNTSIKQPARAFVRTRGGGAATAAAAVAAAAAWCAPAAQGRTVYDAGGFEPPRFEAGASLEDQDPVVGPWVSDGGESRAEVELVANPNGSGAQHVRVTRLAGPGVRDSRWWVNRLVEPSAAQNVVNVDFRMNVAQASGLDFGPVFGVEAYDALTVHEQPLLAGSLGVDATTGDVLYQQAGTGFLAETGAVVSRGQYHTFTLSVDYRYDVYSVSADGVVVHTEAFVDAGASRLTDAPIATVAATADTLTTATGTALFDDYRIKHLIIADANADGTVNVADLGILSTNYNQSVAHRDRTKGDFNRDGVVNVADLGLLATYYGQSNTGPAVVGEASTFLADVAAFPNLASEVPEPAAAPLLALGAGLAVAGRRRRQTHAA